jgi:hypothetical protein
MSRNEKDRTQQDPAYQGSESSIHKSFFLASSAEFVGEFARIQPDY